MPPCMSSGSRKPWKWWLLSQTRFQLWFHVSNICSWATGRRNGCFELRLFLNEVTFGFRVDWINAYTDEDKCIDQIKWHEMSTKTSRLLGTSKKWLVIQISDSRPTGKDRLGKWRRETRKRTHRIETYLRETRWESLLFICLKWRSAKCVLRKH